MLIALKTKAKTQSFYKGAIVSILILRLPFYFTERRDRALWIVASAILYVQTCVDFVLVKRKDKQS